MLSQETRRLTSNALSVRNWLEQFILYGNRQSPPDVDAAAWQVALYQERCSALLLQQVGSVEELQLPAGCVEMVRRSAATEMRQILSARAHLSTLAEVAHSSGVPIAILKGAVALAEGHHIPVADVDVLAASGKEEIVTALLDRLGFAPVAEGGRYHLEPRVMKYTLPIEVHRSILGFADPVEVPWHAAQPVDSSSPLLRLAWPDHVWTVLCQTVLKHPDRLYRIRDLFLVRAGLLACSPDERGALQRRLSAHPLRDEFQRVVAFASGQIGQESLEYINRALVRGYLVLSRTSGVSRPRAGLVTHYMLETAMNGYGAEWRRMVGPHVFPNSPLKVFRRAVRQAWIAGLTRIATLDCTLVG